MQNYEVARVLLCGCSGTQGTGSRQKNWLKLFRRQIIFLSATE